MKSNGYYTFGLAAAAIIALCSSCAKQSRSLRCSTCRPAPELTFPSAPPQDPSLLASLIPGHITTTSQPTDNTRVHTIYIDYLCVPGKVHNQLRASLPEKTNAGPSLAIHTSLSEEQFNDCVRYLQSVAFKSMARMAPCHLLDHPNACGGAGRGGTGWPVPLLTLDDRKTDPICFLHVVCGIWIDLRIDQAGDHMKDTVMKLGMRYEDFVAIDEEALAGLNISIPADSNLIVSTPLTYNRVIGAKESDRNRCLPGGDTITMNVVKEHITHSDQGYLVLLVNTRIEPKPTGMQ